MSTDSLSSSKQLQQVRDWAQAKINTGAEPPWAWYQYMKLVETADAILSGMAATTTANSPQSDQHPEKHLQLVDSTRPPDGAQPHPIGIPVRLPM